MRLPVLSQTVAAFESVKKRVPAQASGMLLQLCLEFWKRESRHSVRMQRAPTTYGGSTPKIVIVSKTDII
jgi:hypothetical protein